MPQIVNNSLQFVDKHGQNKLYPINNVGLGQLNEPVLL